MRGKFMEGGESNQLGGLSSTGGLGPAERRARFNLSSLRYYSAICDRCNM
jgi:hypothetical protein